MRRYIFSLIPGILLFSLFYLMNPGEINLLLRDFGRVSFFYLTLTLAISPLISLTKKNGLAPYRRVLGIMAFLFAIWHGIMYFYTEYTFQKTFFVLDHFLASDVASGTVAFLVIAVLGITSNNFSVRLLKSAWKKIQILAYPLFLIASLHIAFASRFEGFYMVLIGILVFLRTIAFLRNDTPKVAERENSAVAVISKKMPTKYLCVPCGYIYDEKLGDPDGGIAPGTRFEDIPDDWVCPVCGVGKGDFIPVEENGEVPKDAPAKVITAILLNSTTLELTLETATTFVVIPGQYARVVLQDRDGLFYRSYSVVESSGSKLTFCIKLSSGRWGNVLKNIKVGDTLAVENIYGSFVIQPTVAPKVFIATGTGLAPIINMMSYLPEVDKILLFGVQDSESLFYTDRLEKLQKLQKYIFLSRETVPGFQTGRIDVSKYNFPPECEFYLCGNPKMVEQTITELRVEGFQKIYYEKF